MSRQIGHKVEESSSGAQSNLPLGLRSPSNVISPDSGENSCFEPLMAVKATTTSVGCSRVNVG
jgi:hypothetical protein